jgi:hypothetical protein
MTFFILILFSRTLSSRIFYNIPLFETLNVLPQGSDIFDLTDRREPVRLASRTLKPIDIMGKNFSASPAKHWEQA